MTTPLLNNRYRIIKTLARGGFGETFLAVDTHMPSGRNCVLKQLKPVVQEPEIPQWLQERFQREAAILEKLGENHPQIPKLYAYFSEGGNFYLVQEWIDGLTLTEKQQQQGNLSEEEVRGILVNLLPVLDYVHSRHIIHRDVKPDNIILRASDGKPVLIDFGVMKEAIATAINPQTQTVLSVVLGTPGYMSSEQAAGRPVYSSDLYSLGLTAIFLLTGKTPQALSTDSRTGEILWRQEAPTLHSNLATVIDRAIRFHPRDRFTSAKEMLAALQTAVQPPTGATVAVAPRHLTPPPSRIQPVPTPSPVVSVPSDEETDRSSINLWLVLLLMLGVGIAGFALTFNILSQRLKAPSFPDPFGTIDTTPQTFPTIPAPSPPENSQPQPPATATPEPELSPTPEPEISPIPEPEFSPTPEPEISPIPEPEFSPTPEPEASPTPEPDTSPTPQAQPSSPETPPPATAKPPAATPEPSPPPSPSEEQPLPEGNKSSSIQFPIFATGVKESRVRQILGEPTLTSKGLWGNSRAVLYKNFVPQKVDLGYLFDVKTGQIEQTEVSFAPSVSLSAIKKSLHKLLGGNVPASVKQALEQLYKRQINQYSFTLGNLEGTFQRSGSDRIYIGIWNADFH